jgi:cell division protein FtsN
MARRDYKNARRPQAEGAGDKARKGGGLALGILIGMIFGMTIAGAMYWYLNSHPSGLKPLESAAEIKMPPVTVAPDLPKPVAPATAPKPEVPPAAPKPVEVAAVKAVPEPAGKPDKRKDTIPAQKAAADKSPAGDYSFYDILPGKAAPRPATPSKPKEQYWLQVAALKNAADAERLKARLVLLNLPVAVQKVDSGGQTLHRVRVGPFKSEDDGLGALDTLSENDFEPRWVKDPVNP